MVKSREEYRQEAAECFGIADEDHLRADNNRLRENLQAIYDMSCKGTLGEACSRNCCSGILTEIARNALHGPEA